MYIIMDIFIAILLISAIGYGIMLNNRIMALRRDQKSLEKLAINFQTATKRAEASISKLKLTAQKSADIMNKGTDQAVGISDDLNFLIDRGQKLADHLEGCVRITERSKVNKITSLKTNSSLSDNLDKNNVKLEDVHNHTNINNRRDLGSLISNLKEKPVIKSDVELEFIKALRSAS
ncbi:MAG: hypothetical protein CMM67_06370 [Rhodospirillaceae bacterium]|nr:hypothetical protein [Rhodospirillaceae bacterium]OUT78216.1 MAG: hypothetical protein CBB83_06555 [Rhodospirillaceae bacterium TMED23]